MKRLGIIASLFLIAAIIFGPTIAPYSIDSSNLENSLQSPSKIHVLGTDSNGKDILSLILHGARHSLLISIVVVSLCVFIGLMTGFLSGFFGGWYDRIYIFISDVFQAFPGILLAISIAAFMQPSLLNLILLLCFTGWVSYSRVTRAQILELKSREFIVAAEAIGVPRTRLFVKYILPNISAPIIVQASFGLAGVILAESSLSFLGLGLPAQIPSLGKLLDSGVNLLLIAPHVSLFPGAAIMIFVLGFNLLGDYLRSKLIQT